MVQINCLRCKGPVDSQLEQCPSCGEKVTSFQRTYSARLIDGKYQILDRLGVGGMGEIFKVRHIHLNELRVIKIMRPNVAADDQGLQRFLQEARTSTMIKHRNLAMLYDFAQLDDGSYYMVWEFIDGVNIQKWISQSGAVPPRLTVEIAIQALQGLDHLHAMGLIHRDISPENIMLSQDHHGKLLVKVIDFGIAKSLAEGDSGQGLTQTGMFLGKLKYASPEQAGFLKDGENLDARSDLYSFGIVLYEMLAGRAPFQATNPHGYILKHVTEKPPRIIETNPEAKVPANLEALIMRALEKSRDTRFATAADFATALEEIRPSIPPDVKYGVGERMVTLSAAKTLADLPKYTPTGANTMGAAQTQQTQGATGTRAGSGDATVVERSFTASGMQQTVVDRPTMGGNDATVVERLGSIAEKTQLEPKAGFGGSAAEATVLEPKYQAPEKKSKTGLIAAIAAIVLLVIGIGAWMSRDAAKVDNGKPPITNTGGPVTGVEPGSAARDGVLLLSATPWGDIEKIVNAKSQASIKLTEDDRSTPSRIQLAAGQYQVTIKGPNDAQTIDVLIEPGKSKRVVVPTGDVNYDELQKEVNRP